MQSDPKLEALALAVKILLRRELYHETGDARAELQETLEALDAAMRGEP